MLPVTDQTSVIFWVTLFYKSFADKFDSKILILVVDHQFSFYFHISECKDLIIQCLRINPRERIELEEILHHPWMSLSGSDPRLFVSGLTMAVASSAPTSIALDHHHHHRLAISPASPRLVITFKL